MIFRTLKFTTVSIAIWTILTLLPPSGNTGEFATTARAADNSIASLLQAAAANPQNAELVQRLFSALPEVPPDSGRYIVEGDIAINREEILAYIRTLGTNKEVDQSGELIVNCRPDGGLDFWEDPAERQLTYAIDRASFPDGVRANEISERFANAAASWVEACPKCGISFEEIPETEAGPAFTKVVFVVRFLNVAGGPVARAFFPSSPPSEYEVTIFPKFFSPKLRFDKTGVLRHEIGHILGYRHEHIVNIPGCENEGGSWVPLTPYTPNSVMHYFCGDAGSFDLSLRQADIDGHRCLYLKGALCPQPQ